MTTSRTSFSGACRWLAPLCLLLAVSLPLAAQDRTAVIGARAALQPWSDPLEALGTLRADESVTLSATVTELVAELNFRDGEAVEAGRMLIRLEDGEEQAQLRAAQALRDERRSAVDRLTQLQNRNMAPRADVEDSQARLRQVEAEIQGLEARLTNYRLRAPFDGVVGFRNISVGSLVTPGTELVTLDKLDVMKLDFSVPELYLAILEPGLPLSARSVAFPDELFEGEVSSIGSRVDPVSRSVTIRAEIDNPELRLRPGMLMEVILQRSPRQAVVVPESALIPSGDRQYVLVIDEADENRVERREVRVGERRIGQAEILEGLEPDDLIVSHGVQRAREGDRVQLLGIADDEMSIREILEAHRDEGDA
ncbi:MULTISPECIES: efflux RND transporter periplasmic adaptor subunit [Halomonadaceae]|jgi:membrane fusion protein (multidrug efflux system)|uniref:Efflux RND transporter periplasmic adaptor subunit n=1 Tax=Billgrantia aerodenitrificans TaxID=2733483 RepID=A0ABS9ATJ3_9GAMM|nr:MULTISPECIES: efflux RND transporter periplasmic adaptor subunit [Halomonas]MCE8025029.1 efflux RND transporter periplasmic adaptor subunit [Halomonas aerodenitrificans]MCE8037016.1 efflux RND transporter periplasmic adaptor subunit [Halomonas sp. MCCC 1A11062]